jgi:hypothetical protein
MLIKWISCSVAISSEVGFSTAQSRWRQLKEVPGFIGQIGGWERTCTRLIAHIFGFWSNSACYEKFMDELHDEIYKETQQKGTYESIDIQIAELTEYIEEAIFNNLDRVVIYTSNGAFRIQLQRRESVVFEAELPINDAIDLVVELEQSWSVQGCQGRVASFRNNRAAQSIQ